MPVWTAVSKDSGIPVPPVCHPGKKTEGGTLHFFAPVGNSLGDFFERQENARIGNGRLLCRTGSASKDAF